MTKAPAAMTVSINGGSTFDWRATDADDVEQVYEVVEGAAIKQGIPPKKSRRGGDPVRCRARRARGRAPAARRDELDDLLRPRAGDREGRASGPLECISEVSVGGRARSGIAWTDSAGLPRGIASEAAWTPSVQVLPLDFVIRAARAGAGLVLDGV
jgi:hypothetical protein